MRIALEVQRIFLEAEVGDHPGIVEIDIPVGGWDGPHYTFKSTMRMVVHRVVTVTAFGRIVHNFPHPKQLAPGDNLCINLTDGVEFIE